MNKNLIPNRRKCDLPSALASRAANRRRKNRNKPWVIEWKLPQGRWTVLGNKRSGLVDKFPTKKAARSRALDLEFANANARGFVVRVVQLAILAFVLVAVTAAAVGCGDNVTPAPPDAADPSCASIGCTVTPPFSDMCALRHVCYCEPTGEARRCVP